MASENSVIPYLDASNKDLTEAAGITRISGASATEWNQLINGLIFQGGLSPSIALDSSQAILFSVVFPTKCLGVFLQAVYSPAGAGNENSGLVSTAGLSTSGFTLINDGTAKQFYWWAIGI